jgi:hypothetical protein
VLAGPLWDTLAARLKGERSLESSGLIELFHIKNLVLRVSLVKINF